MRFTFVAVRSVEQHPGKSGAIGAGRISISGRFSGDVAFIHPIRRIVQIIFIL
jgi:hypothetical protein